MTHDERIHLAYRRLLAARSMHQAAQRDVWSPETGFPFIDWPAVSFFERQRAAAELRGLIDMRKQESK